MNRLRRLTKLALARRLPAHSKPRALWATDDSYRRRGVETIARPVTNPSPDGDPLALLREAERRCEVGQ